MNKSLTAEKQKGGYLWQEQAAVAEAAASEEAALVAAVASEEAMAAVIIITIITEDFGSLEEDAITAADFSVCFLLRL